MNFDQPIFILGNPRSGTTLLRLMLNAHPLLCIPPECGFMEWWHNKYQYWNVQHNNDSDITDFISDLKTSKKIETWKLDYSLLMQTIKEQRPTGYGQLCALVYYTISIQQNKKAEHWGDKNNYYIHRLQLLQQLYPEAKYLMIIRDGRDVAVSYRGVEKLVTASVYKPKLPQAINDIAGEWLVNNNNILDFLKHSPVQHLIIRYEDLVTDSTSVLKKICLWLKIGFDENMLLYYKQNGMNEKEPASLIDWKKKTLEAPDANRIGQYKTEIAGSEIKAFESIAGILLKAFNYS